MNKYRIIWMGAARKLQSIVVLANDVLHAVGVAMLQAEHPFTAECVLKVELLLDDPNSEGSLYIGCSDATGQTNVCIGKSAPFATEVLKVNYPEDNR